MEMNFHSRCSIQESTDPTLDGILRDCEIQADIEIRCEAEHEGAYLTEVQIEDLRFEPPDSEGAVKAMALMHPELMESIRRALEDEVRKTWLEYERQAEDHYRDMEDAAADELYERWKEER